LEGVTGKHCKTARVALAGWVLFYKLKIMKSGLTPSAATPEADSVFLSLVITEGHVGGKLSITSFGLAFEFFR